MVEVFKTNVQYSNHAQALVTEIHEAFNNYKVNFDLEDCDRVLRVECKTGEVDSSLIIKLLKGFGFDAEVLPDEDYEDSKIFFSEYKS